MKKVTMILAIIVVILALIILTINLYVKETTKKQIINNSDYTKLENIDCIIVLGAGIWGDKPSPMLEDRLLEGINLYNNNVSNNDFNIPSSPIEESPQMGYSQQTENNYNNNSNFIPLSANNLGIEEPLVNMPSYDNSINPGFMDIDKIEKQNQVFKK